MYSVKTCKKKKLNKICLVYSVHAPAFHVCPNSYEQKERKPARHLCYTWVKLFLTEKKKTGEKKLL